jgi:uncharacterized protein YdaT
VPRTADYFPVSMKHLSPLVRKKAIEIANAFLDEDMDEGKAIRIAVGMGRAAERNRIISRQLPLAHGHDVAIAPRH